MPDPSEKLNGKGDGLVHEGAAKDAHEDSSSTRVLPYLSLFKYAEPLDVLLIVLGSLGGIGNGACFPAFALLFGEFTDTFGEKATMGDFKDLVVDLAVKFMYIAVASLLCSYLQTSSWMWAGNRQTNTIRRLYLRAVLRQDVSYFDTHATSGGLMTGLSEDSVIIQQGISEKVGNFLQHSFTFIFGYAIAFYRGWDLALVMVGCLPLLAVVGALFAKYTTGYAAKASQAYQVAAGTVNEAVVQIRTVQAYHQQERHVKEYDAALETPFQVGRKQSLLAGLTMGGANGVAFLTYGVALFYGAWRVSHKVLGGYYSGGDVLSIIIAALIGGFALGQAAPNVSAFTKARVSAARVFDVIERKPDIDIEDEGEQLAEVVGEIELRKVNFAYPARLDVQIFSDFSLVVPAGKTVALVGSSGSGKSTVVQLIERFYDPLSGAVLLDGVDVRTLQLAWLRSQLGLVSQEPTLFATSIFENIAMGKAGATVEEVEAAARDANAHTFISKLPLKYDTFVGERGLQLSGGQKQRIAIARAILKNPKVLLLDEATSALDTKSERAVQAALDRLVVGRTTVVVAHRLSTVQGADAIAVLQDGRLVEQGAHAELLQRPDGAYTALVTVQMQAAKQQVGDGKKDAGPGSATIVEEGDDDDTVHIVQDAVQPAGGTLPVSLKESDVEQGKGADQAPADKKAGKQEKEEQVNVPLSRLFGYNKPETTYIVVGGVASAVVGAIQPAVAYTLSEVLSIYYEKDKSKILDKALLYSCLMGLIGIVNFVAAAIMHYAFGVLGANLSRRLRQLLLSNILRQEVAFFDDPKHSSAALASRLSEDTTHIRGAVGDTLSLICQNMTCLVVGYLIALRFDWRMALVVTGCLPLVVSSMAIYFKFMTGASSAADTLYNSANQTVTDAFRSIRTIHAYNLRDTVCTLYSSLLAPAQRTMFKTSQLTGISMGYSNFVVFGIYGIIIWFGGEEVSSGRATFDEMFKSFMAVMLAAQGLAQAQAGFPDIGKAKDAVQRLFPILDRKSAIDAADPTGETPSECKGAITLRDVGFVYPQRPEVQVLQSFSLDIPVGKVVALVGESGCGKSTIIALMERFYDPVQGVVMLDGVDIRRYQVKWLRAQMALVSQEPLLFSCSILENIRYGRPGASMEEVVSAAKAANAHAFIEQLPEKYDTQVGEGGIQLSGGQKQRVAIARAVIKNPRILLLDEATSALDASAEKLVQGALDAIMVGRTSVVVAHRLSTIRHAHCITFMHQGAILEKGTHEELMAKADGGYARLVAAQMAHSPTTTPSSSQADLTAMQ